MKARRKYLKHYAEAEAQALLKEAIPRRWQQVLVIPAYREAATLVEHLAVPRNTLLTLVLNRPDSEADSHCNDALRQRLHSLPEIRRIDDANARLLALDDDRDVLLFERPAALPGGEGVGLARKIGCDAALALCALGCIESPWIHCTDADARLPEDYFSAAARIDSAVALTYPYRHTRPTAKRERQAIDVYECYLRRHVDGLRFAGSPYAFHTLGSCIAVNADAYAQVRGFPRRAGGEDFYLLNKLAKQGRVVTPESGPIRLSARLSQRAPFGTGPALLKILEEEKPENARLFYHPHCYEDLRRFLTLVNDRGEPGLEFHNVAAAVDDDTVLAAALEQIALPKFLTHARHQCADRDSFLLQFHQWFDGFRTLKFIHAVCASRGRVTLSEFEMLQDRCVE